MSRPFSFHISLRTKFVIFIGAIISAKPQERRQMLEEGLEGDELAAGGAQG